MLTDGDFERHLFIAECRAVGSQLPSSLAGVGANAPRIRIDETLSALQSGAYDQAKDRSPMITTTGLLNTLVLRKSVPEGGARFGGESVGANRSLPIWFDAVRLKKLFCYLNRSPLAIRIECFRGVFVDRAFPISN